MSVIRKMAEDPRIVDGGYEAQAGDYFELLKPRVMSLVVFTALVGMLAAPTTLHPVEALASLIFIAVGAGAAGALNMWWDADLDIKMRRTRNRPIPSSRLTRQDALSVGLALSGFSVMMLALSANLLAAALLAFTIFFYVVIYSMLLKLWTPQNIVIGGAAGAFPPMVGWVAATGSISIEAVLMFALIFVWTPPHFWALALFMRSDYDNAGVPMLTVTHGRPSTRRHVFIYSLVLIGTSFGIAVSGLGGALFLATAVICNGIVLVDAWFILRRDEVAAERDNYKVEKRFFKFSLLYLFAHFAVLLIESILQGVL